MFIDEVIMRPKNPYRAEGETIGKGLAALSTRRMAKEMIL